MKALEALNLTSDRWDEALKGVDQLPQYIEFMKRINEAINNKPLPLRSAALTFEDYESLILIRAKLLGDGYTVTQPWARCIIVSW